MLELLFQGFFEWLYGMILEAWEYFSGGLIDLMSMDFAYLQTHIPVLPTIRQSMLAVGWALLIGNLVFQALRSMLSGIGFEAEDPKLLFARTFVFSFLLLASPQICELCLNMTSNVIRIVELPDVVDIEIIQESAFDGLVCAWLLVFICGIIVMFQAFKLIFEMAERYFILAMLTICSPLAFGVGGSRSTSDIFSGWCRMYGSMCLLMVLNVVFVKLLLSVLSTVPTGLSVLPWMVLVLSIVKVAKKADAIVTRIGLNPAITGDSLGRTLPGMLAYVVMHTAVTGTVRSAWQSIGKSSGAGTQAKSGQGKNVGAAGFRGGQGAKPNQANPAKQGHTQQSGAHGRNQTRQGNTQQSPPPRTRRETRPVNVSADDFNDGDSASSTARSTSQPERTPTGGVDKRDRVAAGAQPTRKTARPRADAPQGKTAPRAAKPAIQQEHGTAGTRSSASKASAEGAENAERHSRNTHARTQNAARTEHTTFSKAAQQETRAFQPVKPDREAQARKHSGTAGTKNESGRSRLSQRQNLSQNFGDSQTTRTTPSAEAKPLSPAQQESQRYTARERRNNEPMPPRHGTAGTEKPASPAKAQRNTEATAKTAPRKDAAKRGGRRKHGKP